MVKTTPRQYQIELFQKACEQNTIVVLETGSGKTLIAVLLIEEMLKREPTKKVAFLVGNRILANQQAKVMYEELDLPQHEIGEYTGDANMLHSPAKEYDLKSKKILVMTAQTLFNSLQHAIISMDDLSLLIVDECHHCKDSHPFNTVMQHFYFPLKKENRPKVFGMTASPVNLNRNRVELIVERKQILERNMDSRLYMCGDSLRENINQYINTPEEISVEYEPADWDDTYINFVNACGPVDDDILATAKVLAEELGLWSVRQYLMHCAEKKKFRVDNDVIMESLNAITTSVEDSMTDKAKTLFTYLKSLEGIQNFRALVFVERRQVAKSLSQMLSILLPNLLRASYLVGHNASGTGDQKFSSKQQREIVAAFDAGKINLIVATSIAEEGLDIQACDLVIRFTMPRDLISYVQSRGRARQMNSRYVIMMEKYNASATELLSNITLYEDILKLSLWDPDFYTRTPEIEIELKADYYKVESTGAKATLDSAISLINHFCSKLTTDGYTKPNAEYTFENEGSLFKCTLTLPSVCNLNQRSFTGRACSKKNDTKRWAALQAVKYLHLYRELNDRLLPMSKEEISDKENIISPKDQPSLKLFNKPYDKKTPDAFRKSDTFHTYRVLKDSVPTGLAIVLYQKTDAPVIDLYCNNGPTPSKIELEYLRSDPFSTELESTFKPHHQLFVKEICLSSAPPITNEFYLIPDQFLDGIDTNDIEKMVVKTKYGNGKLYAPKCLRGDMSPLTEFEQTQKRTDKYNNYLEYFKVRWEIDIKDPNQPILEVYTYTKIRNFVVPPLEGTEYERSSVFLIPELVEPTQYLASLFLFLPAVPSYIYLLESYLLAMEYKERFQLPTTLQMVHTALSIPQANLQDNYERLEFLGDSALKVMACKHFFRAYPQKQEGALSYLKHMFVSNINLYYKACNVQIPAYMTGVPFQKRDWFVQRESSQVFAMKTIADVVEATIGGCYVAGGMPEAVKFCLGIGLDLERSYYDEDNMDVDADLLEKLYDQVQGLQDEIGYHFNSKKLLVQSCTHASYRYAPCYQRIEYLGDANLDLVVSDYLYKNYAELSPEMMTDIRSEIVNNNSFNSICLKLGYYKYLIHNSDTLFSDIAKYQRRVDEENRIDDGPKVLSDLFEAIAGAIFIDSGFDQREVYRVFEPLLHEYLAPKNVAVPTVEKHPVSELQEFSQKEGIEVDYRTEGRDIVVYLDDIEISRIPYADTNNSKKVAKRDVAVLALQALKEQPQLLVRIYAKKLK
jgi:endoribonuclease Dicer